MCESLVKAWIDHIVMSEYFNMCWCLPLYCCKITCLLFKFKFTILILWDTGFIARGTILFFQHMYDLCQVVSGICFLHKLTASYILVLCV